MARLGRPMLLRGRSTTALGQSIQLYRDEMVRSEFDEEAVERALDESWVWRELYLAETDDQAFEEFLPAFDRAYTHMADVRERWNPVGQPVPKQQPPLPRSAYEVTPDPGANEALVGSPRRVAEQVALLRDVGARNLMLTHRGLVPRDRADSSLKLLSEKIMPLFRSGRP